MLCINSIKMLFDNTKVIQLLGHKHAKVGVLVILALKVKVGGK
jgi:hypothetical protein